MTPSSDVFDATSSPVLLNTTTIPSEWLRKNFAMWAAFSGIECDNHKFTYDGHSYLWPLFGDKSENIVLMKAAQMGATIYMILKSFHMALYPEAWGFPHPIKVGFYFPEQKGISRIIIDRILPMMRSSDDLRLYSKDKRQELRQIGRSTLYYLYMGGKSTKDSVPLNALFIDEVRLITLGDIYQAYKRLLHSVPYKFKNHVSTAGYPENDIHKLFLNTDQKWFTTICERCGCEQVLPLEFPECIAMPAAHSTTAGQVYYKCKKCTKKLRDPQVGRYIPHGDPNHEYSGYQISQLISHRITAKEIMQEYDDTTNMKEFYNAILGMPFVDAKNKPVTLDILEGAINSAVEWGEAGTYPCYMGVDQMLNLNYVWVTQRRAGKRRVIWFEIIESEDPWQRTNEIFEMFNVQVCICDALPNANEALRWAKTHEKKIFLVYYVDSKEQVRWNDSFKTKKTQKKANPETYYKYSILLDRYSAVEYTLKLFEDDKVEFPVPEDHLVKCHPYNGGPKQAYPILRTHAFPMLCCGVRERIIIEEETGKDRYRWNFIGMDPHALHSFVYAVWASERKGFSFSFSM